MQTTGLKLRMGLTIGVLAVVYLFVVSQLAGIANWILPGGELVAFAGALAATGLLMALQYVGGIHLTLQAIEAEPLAYEDAPDLHDRVDELAAEMDVARPDLMVGTLGGPNAFALGRRNNGTIVLGRDLFDLMNRAEFDAIVGHELAHLQHRDVVVMSMAGSIITLAALFVKYVVLIPVVLWSFGFEFAWGMVFRGSSPIPWSTIYSGVGRGVALVVSFALSLFYLALSRHREYVADATAARLVGDADPMASSLEKIGDAPPPARNATQNLSALCISGDQEGLLTTLLADHPPISDRIDALEAVDPADE